MQGIAEICARMRRWPLRVMPDNRSLARECLELCCQLFDSRQGVLALEERDEPWLLLAELSGGVFTWREEEHVGLDELVDPRLDGCSFFAESPHGILRTMRGISEDDIQFEISGTMAGIMEERLMDAPCYSVFLNARDVQGRLFVVRPEVDAETAVAVSGALSLVLAQRFEATSHMSGAIRDAVAEERIRVARDLHDGLLQSFTGVVLQLETVHSVLDRRPEEARRMITEAQSMMMADQRELRRFVEQLRPRPQRMETAFDFAGRLEELGTRFAKQWGVRIIFDVEKIDPQVSEFLGQETFRLIHEAVTNSAKHGQAREIKVSVRTIGSEMEIRVADNGSGFAFQGCMTLEDMRMTGSGPTVLAERVISLNGSLTVESADGGATVTMSVPLGWGASES